jgi:hypothetical protein
MLRTFRIAMVSAAMLLTACKTEKSEPRPEAAKAAKPVARPAAPEVPAIKPAAPAATNTELETKGIAMMQRMADMFAADARDCDKLAADLRTFIASNKALLAQLADADQQQSDEQRESFSARNGDVQAAVAAKMQGAMTACAANPGVLAAMKEFPGGE